MSKMKTKAIEKRNRQKNLDNMWSELKTKVTTKTYNLITKIVNLEIEIEKDCNL